MSSSHKVARILISIVFSPVTPALQVRAANLKIYIDSVPQGAAVMLLPKSGETDKKEVKLGETPLVVDSSQTPGMRFSIMMTMSDFLKKIEPIPELQDWASHFKSDQYFNAGGAERNYFTFDTGESHTIQSMDGALIGIGPIYDLSGDTDSSTAIRLCALFIPRGVKREAFFPLMPKPGTFPQLPATWRELLRSKYHLSDAQVDIALGSLTRAGKYIV